MAYDLDTNSGANGDTFMVNQQAWAGTVPTHTCPGNHESSGDFTQYIARLGQSMPSSAPGSNGTYHSFNVGLTHVILLSSEAYFYLSDHGLIMLPTMYQWLVADLQAVNRSATPWIIAMVRTSR